MFSLSEKELLVARNCIAKVAKKHEVAAACVYGSKAAGYARPSSDIDLLVVLDKYPFAIKYVYLKEAGIEVSLLVISKKSLEADAHNASLGEFAVGRLLHIYEPLVNGDLLHSIERAYKKRVVLEELQRIVDSTSLLSTEILIPLEYFVFARIKQRILRYPNATYSYYKTYSGSASSVQNLQFALKGYRDALAEIMLEDSELFSHSNGHIQISENAVRIDKGKVRLKLASRLQQLGSYFVHTYAGRQIMHLMVREAESKIRRKGSEAIGLPEYMDSPRKSYWRLSEGELIVESKDWLEELATKRGIGNFKLAQKRRLGNLNSRTILYDLKYGGGEYKIAVKELARTKSMKWAALSLWTAPVKHFKVGPLFRLATEYKGSRFIRSLGLDSPRIEAVVLDERLLITRFIEGRTMAEVIRRCLVVEEGLEFLRLAGTQIARVHNAGASLGNIKPKNIIVNGARLYFTDLEQFLFSPSDQLWDLAQFICWDLKGTGSTSAASRVVREFLQGYCQNAKDRTNVARLSKSRRYIESFFPVLNPSVARAIKTEIRKIAS